MAKNLLNKYVWLVDTIYKAKRITFEEINLRVNVETVKFKVSAGQANYLRTLTLHQTQKEIKRTDEYSIFTVRLRPTFDFRQEILSQGSNIEVLEPKWFRNEITEISKQMWNIYQND